MRAPRLLAALLFALATSLSAQSATPTTCASLDCAQRSAGVPPIAEVALVGRDRELRFLVQPQSPSPEPMRLLVVRERGGIASGDHLLLWPRWRKAGGAAADSLCAERWPARDGDVCRPRHRPVVDWKRLLRDLDAAGLRRVADERVPEGPLERCGGFLKVPADPPPRMLLERTCPWIVGLPQAGIEMRSSAGLQRYPFPEPPTPGAKGIARDIRLLTLLYCAADGPGQGGCPVPAPLPPADAAGCRDLITAKGPLDAAGARDLALGCGPRGRERLLHRYRIDRGTARGNETALITALATMRSPATLDAVLAVLDDPGMTPVAHRGAAQLVGRLWSGATLEEEHLARIVNGTTGLCVEWRRGARFPVDEGLGTASTDRSWERLYRAVLRDSANHGLADIVGCHVTEYLLPPPIGTTPTAEMDAFAMGSVERQVRFDSEPPSMAFMRRFPWWRIVVPETTPRRAEWRALATRLREAMQGRDSVASDSSATLIRVSGFTALGDVVLFTYGTGTWCRRGGSWYESLSAYRLAAVRTPTGWRERTWSDWESWGAAIVC